MLNILNKSLYLVLLSGGIFLIFKNNQDLNNLQFYLIFFMFICMTTIIFLPIIKIDFIGKLPLIYLVNMYFLICYIGVFFFDKDKIFSNLYDKNDHAIAINTLFIGYSFFLLGYFSSKKFLKNFKRASFAYLDSSLSEIFLIGILLLSAVIIFFYFLNIQIYLPFLAQLKYPILLLGIGLCFKRILQKNLNNFQFYLLIILIILPIFFELLTGSFNFPFMIALLIYAQYTVNKKIVNLFPFIILLSLFLFINIGKYDYRSQTWLGKDLNLNWFDKSKIFFNNYTKSEELITVDGETKNKNVNIHKIFQGEDIYTIVKRIVHSYESLLIVTKNTPKKIPFWRGYSYQILKYKFIPRVFWKDKPQDKLGNEFGHRYNVLNIDTAKTQKDYDTSWNMPVLNEFYVNFGNFGVIFGMLFIGVLMNLITKISTLKNDFNLEAIIYFYLFIPIFFLESHLSLLIGALFQSYIFLLITCFCFLFLLRKVFSLK